MKYGEKFLEIKLSTEMIFVGLNYPAADCFICGTWAMA